MNAPASLGKVDQLRLRDGDCCWLCAGKMDFAAEPNSKKAPTIEHLVAKANGGGNELSNLVLTHPTCNRQLGDKPIEQKHAIRAKHLANREKVQAAKAQAATSPSPKTVKATAAATAFAPMVLADVTSNSSASTHGLADAMADEVRFWRRLALVGGGLGLTSAGFAAGLVVGLTF